MSCFCLINPLKAARYEGKMDPSHVKTGVCFKRITPRTEWLAMGKGLQH